MYPDYMFAMAVMQDRLKFAETRRTVRRPAKTRPARTRRNRSRAVLAARAGERA